MATKKKYDRKPKVPKLDFDALPNAVQDSKLVATLEQKVLLKRQRSNGDVVSVCQIMKAEDDGDVVLWDITLDQNFIFNVIKDKEIYLKILP